MSKYLSEEEENDLYTTIQGGRPAEIIKFIGHINYQRKADGYTPLFCATSHNQSATVEYLLSLGANPNIKSKTDLTVLDLVIRITNINLNIIKTLISKGAKLSIDKFKFCEKSINPDIIKILSSNALIGFEEISLTGSTDDLDDNYT